jgi:hypothetical protein
MPLNAIFIGAKLATDALVQKEPIRTHLFKIVND